MDRAIQCSWLTFAAIALFCTVALLWVGRDAPRVLKINEGRTVVSAGEPGDSVTPRGNRKQRTFFSDLRYRTFRPLLAKFCVEAGTAV